MVMTSGGSPIQAWYASTHGGYVFTSAEVWGGSTSYTKHATDTTTGSAGGFGDLQSNAYDRSSPWFYCDWGSRSNYNNTAWLRSDEVADIANTLLLVKRDPATTEHLYQTDKPNPAGTDTWDEARVRQELQNKGITPFTSVSNISIGADFGYGKTNSVSVSGNKSESFNGDEWKSRFNLRAPANIQIVGPLYNVEIR
jgi:peptidoglycan hydrolase-like amidase